MRLRSDGRPCAKTVGIKYILVYVEFQLMQGIRRFLFYTGMNGNLNRRWGDSTAPLDKFNSMV